jgi:hypothetical protein
MFHFIAMEPHCELNKRLPSNKTVVNIDHFSIMKPVIIASKLDEKRRETNGDMNNIKMAVFWDVAPCSW